MEKNNLLKWVFLGGGILAITGEVIYLHYQKSIKKPDSPKPVITETGSDELANRMVELSEYTQLTPHQPIHA